MYSSPAQEMPNSVSGGLMTVPVLSLVAMGDLGVLLSDGIRAEFSCVSGMFCSSALTFI